jgi:hypothetical protein
MSDLLILAAILIMYIGGALAVAGVLKRMEQTTKKEDPWSQH